MAIAFDAASSGECNPGTSVTFAHTCTGSNGLLLVAVHTNGTTDKVTSVTYNGVAMTRLTSVTCNSTNFLSFLYYLFAPNTGANNIVVTLSSSDAAFVMGTSYTGVKQSAFPDSSATGTDATGGWTGSSTVVDSNCWLYVTGRGNGTITVSSGGTLRAGRQTDNQMAADSNGTVGTGSQSIVFNESPGGENGWIAASFAPFVASSLTRIAPRLNPAVNRASTY